jgi:beta-galactosidase
MSDVTFEKQLGFYPYGVQYYRAPTPLPEEWEVDLKEISKIGYTHIQLRPQWRWHERERDHALWDDLDRLFDLAHKFGLRVILKPMLETVPDWVFDELDGTRIGFHGIPISPYAHGAFYVGGWLPCFDNPQVVRAASSFVRRMVERYHNHPALWFYDAWNEPVSRPLGQCQCRHSVKSYQDWLRRRFKTVDALNNFAGKGWSSFESIRPPSSAADHFEMFMWRQWAVYAISQHVRFVSDAIRQADANAFIMAHAGGPSVVQDVAAACSDDLLNMQQVDRYGTSFNIPLNPITLADHAFPDYESDWIRRVDPLYWCHEFYTNHDNWCKTPDCNTLRRLIWMAISGGAAGFTFWQYRSERVGCETNGYGIREIDGSPTERSGVTDSIAMILKDNGARLAGTQRIPSQVALLYHRESDLISRIQDMHARDIMLENISVDYPYKKRLAISHALFLQAGETADWVVPGDDLSRFKVLHAGCVEIMDSSTADWLQEYVDSGGVLVVEFPFACRDSNTWVSKERPNNGLEDLLGCRETRRVTVDMEEEHKAIFENGIFLTPFDWRMDLEPCGNDAEILAQWSDGAVAAVCHKYGKGKVFSFGASFSSSYVHCPDKNPSSIINQVLESAGLHPHADAPAGVWVRRRRGDDHEVWFVFNVSDKTERLSLPATPNSVWDCNRAEMDGRILTLAPGSAWVGEMPLSRVNTDIES